MIAYVNDFRLMLYLTLAVIPLLLLIKPPSRDAEQVDSRAAID